MGALSRDQIRSVQDRKPHKVDVPEWDGYVMVRPMSVGEREALEATVSNRQGANPNTSGLRVRAMIATCLDDNGERLFRYEDAEWLQEKAAGPVDRIAEIALGIAGMGKDALAQAEGNSGGNPGSDSSIGLPPPSAAPWVSSETGWTPSN